MIKSLGNKTAKDIWEDNESRVLPRALWVRVKALLTIMYNTDRMEDLKIKGQPPNIRLHKLKGDLREYWSVTVELPWCIIFKYQKGYFDDVQIVNYHKG